VGFFCTLLPALGSVQTFTKKTFVLGIALYIWWV